MLHFVLRVAEQAGDLGSILSRKTGRPTGAIDESLNLILRHVFKHILAVGRCVRTALIEKLGAVDNQFLKRFLTQQAFRFLDLLLREDFFEQALDGQRVPVRALKQELAAGVGRLDQVVGQHLFLGRKLGPNLSTGSGTLHADSFRQWQRFDVCSLAQDAGNTSENQNECQQQRDAHHCVPTSVSSNAKSNRNGFTTKMIRHFPDERPEPSDTVSRRVISRSYQQSGTVRSSLRRVATWNSPRVVADALANCALGPLGSGVPGAERLEESRAADTLFFCYFLRTSFIPQHISFAGAPFSQAVALVSMWSSSMMVRVASCMCLSLLGSRLPPPLN